MQINDVIAAYRAVRAQKEDIQKRHQEEVAPFNDQLEKLGNWLLRQLQQDGLQNFKGSSGVAFLQSTMSVTVADRDSLLDWIKTNEAWEFLENRVSKSAVQEYVEEHKEAPPGVAITTAVEVRVRAS